MCSIVCGDVCYCLGACVLPSVRLLCVVVRVRLCASEASLAEAVTQPNALHLLSGRNALTIGLPLKGV